MAKLTNAVKGAIKTASGKIEKTSAKAGVDKPSASSTGPSPSPMTNVILADVLLRAGGQLLRRSVETGLLGRQFGKGKAKKIVKGRSMAQTLVGTAIARIATRSVPGAIVIGGGLLAKTLYDRRRAAKAAKEGEEAVEKQADKA